MQIKPAGWVVIFLALGGAGFGVWHFFGPQIVEYLKPVPPPELFDGGLPSLDGGSPSDAGSVDAGTDDAGAATIVDGGALAEASDAGPGPTPTIAVARSLPPLSLPPTVIAGSEGAVLHLVATEQVRDGIVSVAALAAHPEAVAFGVRAIWLAGDTVNEVSLLPSCDPIELLTAKLGVVGGSLSHLHLLSLLGSPLPPIIQFDSAAALEAAYADGTINGGEAPVSRRGSVAANCLELAKKADPLVLVHKVGRPVSKADALASVPMKGAAPTAEQVKAFFGEGSDSFDALFRSASQKWLEAKVIPAVAAPADAVDRRLLEKPTPPPSPTTPSNVTPADAGSAAVSPYGFPSWVDTH